MNAVIAGIFYMQAKPLFLKVPDLIWIKAKNVKSTLSASTQIWYVWHLSPEHRTTGAQTHLGFSIDSWFCPFDKVNFTQLECHCGLCSLIFWYFHYCCLLPYPYAHQNDFFIWTTESKFDTPPLLSIYKPLLLWLEMLQVLICFRCV